MSFTIYFDMSVTRKPYSGLNAYGDPTYGTTGTITARWPLNEKLVRNASGDIITVESKATTSTELTLGDVLVHPNDSREWTVASVEERRDHTNTIRYYTAKMNRRP